MSLHGKIDLSRPLTKEEAEWLQSRAGGHDLVAVNRRQFKDLSKTEKAEVRKQSEEDEEEEKKEEEEIRQAEEDDDSFEPEDLAQVLPLSLRELREFARHNGLDDSGSKDELQITALEYLEAKRLKEDSK